MKQIYVFFVVLVAFFNPNGGTAQSTCSTLAITNTVSGSVCGGGSVVLKATASGTGNDIYWYDAPTGGNIVGIGPEIQTPSIFQTTSYYASEVLYSGGGTLPTYCIPTYIDGCNFWGDEIDSFTLVDSGGNKVIEHLNTGCSSTSTTSGYGDFTGDPNLSINLSPGAVYTFTIAHTFGGQYVAIWMDLNQNGSFSDSGELLFSSTQPSATTTGTITIPPTAQGGSTGLRIMDVYGLIPNDPCVPNGANGETHDYKVDVMDVVCESSRVQAIATVNDIADEQVTVPVPYVHTANTSTYGDNYSGVPGGNCGTTNSYLDGDDVVYHFKPTEDKVVDIVLSGLSGQNASLFVYESCADIGQQCLDGAVNIGSASSFGIYEFTVFNQKDYYLVVSTSGTPQSIGYTLSIDESVLNCTNYQTPPQGNPLQYFSFGETLADLSVTGSNLIWYSDAAGTMMLPGSTPLVDNTDYYVSQSFNTCESNLLMVHVKIQNNCGSFTITSTTGGNIPCFGSTVLHATGSGTPGAQINWYDAQTGGNLVNVGPVFETPVLNQTTSYWVSEVFAGTGLDSLPSGYCIPIYTSTACNTNIGIKDFVLTTDYGASLMEHLNSGCSSSGGNIGYGDFTGNPSLTTTLIPTKTYNITVNHLKLGNLAMALYIDYNRNGSFLDPGEKVFSNENAPSQLDPTIGSFTVPQTALPGVTVMRIYSGFSYPQFPFVSGCESLSFGETQDYKISIASQSTTCASSPEQVTVTNSTDGDVQVPSLPYTTQDNTSNYSDAYTGGPGTNCGIDDNYLNGNDIVYKLVPTVDTTIDILLSDLTDMYGGVFVYDNCIDFGSNCLAGAIAGASSADFGIQNFPVVAGEDYYIVISSWMAPTIGYTLDILPFDCSSLPMPIGNTVQSFYPGAQLKDLTVSTSMPDAVLEWYSNSSGINQISDTNVLVNGATYYVRQTLYNCDNTPLLAITVNEISCAALGITTSDETIYCKGSTTLTATGSGNGSTVYWYDSATNGQLLASGQDFTTPELTQTTSYYASEVKLPGDLYMSGQGKLSPNSVITDDDSYHGLMFDVFNPMTLVNVNIFPSGQAGGIVIIELQNSSGNVLDTASVSLANIPYNGQSMTIPLYFEIMPGTGYRLLLKSSDVELFVDYGGNDFPYGLGNAGEIKSGVSGISGMLFPNSYYYFYSWTIIDHGQVLCQSTPQEVKAIVDPAGEVVLDDTDLPYTTTDNTANYGNDFSGSPGSGCPGAEYLNGADVIYQYTAHPTNDEILTIELTNISNSGTGVFIYDECADIGNVCLAGEVSYAGNNSVTMDNYYVSSGEDIYIVVSSVSGAVNYDLEISKIDCANVPPPTIDNLAPDFVSGESLSDLPIEGNPHRIKFIWYAEASDIPNFPISNPGQTAIVDGEDYYVTQTVLDNCESSALMLVPKEFDCTALHIVSAPDQTICAPGGEVSLNVQGSGVGNDLYWYLSQSGGNVINVGPVFNTIVSQDKSFWVSETFVENTSYENQGKKTPMGAVSAQLYGYGLRFDAFQAFRLVSVDVYPDDPAGGVLTIELRDSMGNMLQNSSLNIPPGNATVPVTIPLDFMVQAGSGYWLAMTAGPPLAQDPADNNFPYPLGDSGALGSITSGRTNLSGFPINSDYYFFYNWTISRGELKCESSRKKVTVTVNNQPTPVPTGNPSQEFCEESILSDIVINGDNILWYEEAHGGMPLSIYTHLQDGETYYASQTQFACESERMAVTVDILPTAPMPAGVQNQLFFQGENLTDLDVQGSNLAWYEDQFGTQKIPDPSNYIIVNQETYYVSQMPNGYCESDLLAITVHLELGFNDPIFKSLVLYPNPVQTRLNIKNTNSINSIVLYDLRGKKVVSKKINRKETTLNASSWATGVYLLKINIEGKAGFFKLVKE